MPFNIPDTGDGLKAFSRAGLQDLANAATEEKTSLRASITQDSATDEQLARLEELQSFVASVVSEVDARDARATRFTATEPTAIVATSPGTDAPADAPVTADGAVDVSSTTPIVDVAGTATAVVAAVVAPVGTAANDAAVAARTVTLADIAPLSPSLADSEGNAPAYTIVASTNIASSPEKIISAGTVLSWDGLAQAFVEQTRGHGSMSRMGKGSYQEAPLALIRRDLPNAVVASDTEDVAYTKLSDTANDYAKGLVAGSMLHGGASSMVAANGWCAPSEPDYSICSPITMAGLARWPEQVLGRGGKIHNQGLDFGDFFGDDFALPIPGYNILTEAQVIADTAKTCVEIPCPAFVDDRLNVAALCLTGSLLQNRGYPEFVRTFMEGAMAAMAHLVNREIINEVVTGSVAIDLRTVDPWGTDGTVWSQVMSLIDFAATDLRYVYRADPRQLVEMKLPLWLLQALRADYIRRNAAANDDLADEVINAALARRRVVVDWVYDWQDSFNAGAHPIAVDANHSMGSLTPATLFNVPTVVSVLAFLPGTWVLGRQDVVDLRSVYDAAGLAQNQVTQLFVEDGWKPMRMCQHSRVYSVTICANGSTGVQRAITCTDVTP